MQRLRGMLTVLPEEMSAEADNALAAKMPIDTPGFQSFGLFHLTEDQIGEAMREFRPFLGRCKFNDCAHLGEPGDAGFHKGADVIVRHQLRELVVVLDQMRSRADDAHVAEEHVPKLRDFIDTQFAEPFSQRINSFIGNAGLTR